MVVNGGGHPELLNVFIFVWRVSFFVLNFIPFEIWMLNATLALLVLVWA